MYSWDCKILVILFSIARISAIKYTSEAENDRVVSLPGQTQPPLSNQFSGFLSVSPTKYIHYYYFEAEVLNPLSQPLVFWTNGGPGCSGLLGLFTEFGPWRPQANGSIAPNPYSWSSVTSLVFLEQPAGVGFSYNTDSSYKSWNDFRAATDNLLILKAFFQRFPEQVTSSGFYIASESYGGHYMPQLTLQIFNDEELNSRFRGMLVGNPFTSFASGSIATANILWGLQLIPQPLWDSFDVSRCSDLGNSAYHYSTNCWSLMNDVNNFADNGALNPYALEFPTCPLGSGYAHTDSKHVLFSPSSQATFQMKNHERMKQAIMNQKNTLLQRNSTWNPKSSGRRAKWTSSVPPMKLKNHHKVSRGYDPCVEKYTITYLNRHDVQDALHVVHPGNTYVKWTVCSDPVNSNWALSDYFGDTTALYSTLQSHSLKPKGFRTLVYSGDADGVCATVGTQHWIYDVAGAEIVSLYQPWTYIDSEYGQQQAGYLTKFSGGFSFATVHHAGHEVPAYQPEIALQLFKNYVNGAFFYNLSTSSSQSETTLMTSSSDSSSDRSLTMAIFVLVVILFLVTVVVIYQYLMKKNFTYNIMEDNTQHSTQV